VTVHLKNIPFKLWSREIAMRILKDFKESTFIDDATTVGSDRRVIYAMIDCHDGRMIYLSVLVHAEGIWEDIFVIVVDWTSIDGPPELAKNYLYGRTGQCIFDMDDSVRKSLARESQRIWNFYRNQEGGGDSNGANSDGGDQ
jgi:hypothetical protein